MNHQCVHIIEIGPQSLKLLQGKVIKGKPCRTVFHYEIFPYSLDDEHLEKALNKFLAKTKNLRPGAWIIVLPRRWAVLKNFSLPILDSEKIEETIKSKISEYTPHVLQDIIYDFSIL
ncbi:MAG: hypothetical protein NUV91_05635, partial [Candidatus Omnitrophica bacterium]|nr:hypothetical protein [Candidatus Omnitrophota bacterium]